MYSTSINISSDLAIQLKNISNDLNISTKKLIIHILQYAISNLKCDCYFSGLTRYQKLENDNEFENFHIRLNENEVKLFFYCRYFFRISLSKLIAVAFYYYFNDLKVENGLVIVKIKNVNSYSHFIPKTILFELKLLFEIKRE